MQVKPLRSPITWSGGKGCFRAKLLPLLPPHRAYVEPFGGGASVLLAKPPSGTEVYNDVDRGLYEFFQVVSSPVHFPMFWARIANLPHSRELYDECRDTWHACRDQMERVWRWYVVARQSFSGCFGGSWGPSVCACHGDQAQTTASWQSAIRLLPLIHQRLQRVQIECCDFRDCLKRYQGPGYLAYCDPPYVWSSRKSGRYNHDLDDNDHRDLVEILLAYDGAVVLSGYPNPLYAPLEAAGWTRLEFACHCTITGRTAAQRKRPQDLRRTECVWRNPEALRRLAAAK
jgi:DNA adenine methylase